MQTTRFMAGAAAAALAGAAAPIASAAPQTVNFPQPDFDRWNYPFNDDPATRGTRDFASVFSDGGFPTAFDLRDAQFVTTFVTSGDVTPGRPATDYVITGATVTATVKDPNGAVLGGTGGNNPVELFATGFRNGFNALAYGETAPYTVLPSVFPPGVRNAFAADASGADASNNPGATPLALGDVAGLNQGDALSAGDLVEFDLDLSGAGLTALLQNGLSAGVLSFSLTSLEPADQTGAGAFPRFATKETDGFAAPTLTLEVEVIPAPGVLAAAPIAAAGRLRRRRRG